MTTPETTETADTPFMSAYQGLKLYDKYTPTPKKHAVIDERALALLTMAIPNDMYARVDNLTSAKEVWDETELQLQGGESALESEKEIAISAYEGSKQKKEKPFLTPALD